MNPDDSPRSPHAPGAPPGGPDRVEILAERLLNGPLAWGVGLTCLALFATWLPGVLGWPWWADHDAFATAARAWDAGLLPYRDMIGNNFPGQLYAFWAVGKLFGWGRTAPFWALDAGLLLLLGAALVGWSRREFGRVLPGWIALAAALGYYFNLDYSQAAQRDWHAPLLALVGLLVLRAWPGRLAARGASAALLAAALLIRPQAALFAPAFVVALAVEPRRSARSALLAVAGWGLAVAGFVGLGLAPLLRAGVADDFLRCLSVLSVGGPYNRPRPARVAWELVAQGLQFRYVLTAGLIAALAVGSPERRRVAAVGLAALAGVWLYRPLSPLHHAYLAHPLALTWAVDLAILAALVLEAGPPRARWRLAAVLLVLGLALPGWPRFSDPRNWRDLAARCRGAIPHRGPPGYAVNPEVPAAAAYGWDDYRRALAYLRALPPGCRVANALSGHAALNGPAGRLPVFPTESISWLAVVRAEDEPAFAAALERADDSVVVWDPGAPGGSVRDGFPRLAAAIARLYEPAARFGPIEVWRRKAGPGSGLDPASDGLAARPGPASGRHLHHDRSTPRPAAL